MFAAFLATLPIYSPNQLLFETELLQRAAYMPAFANTLLGASVVLGVAVAIVSARGRLAVILRGGVVLVASVAYVAGYALFALAAGLESFAQPIFGVTAGLLLAVSTVVLSVAWGAYLGQFNLRQALLWLAVMVGVAALVLIGIVLAFVRGLQPGGEPSEPDVIQGDISRPTEETLPPPPANPYFATDFSYGVDSSRISGSPSDP